MKLIPVISLFSLVFGEYSKTDRCGSANNGLLCDPKLEIGTCCSFYGYCGNSVDHCSIDNGCQSGCVAKPPPPPPQPILGCGDGFCDNRSETCVSCPSDCKCDLQYLDKCTKPGQISLTFDDGPTENTPNLLKTAAKLGVTLTHFVIGEKLANPTYQKFLKQCFNAGHAIASHTFTHPFITKLTDDELRQEMIKTDDAIFKIIGKRPIYMRNPYSDSNERTMALLDSMGYKSIFTSLDSEDTEIGETNPALILQNVIDGLNNDPRQEGLVLTQHETYNVSINYLPQIVNELKKRKYNIIPINECFKTAGFYRNDVCGDGKCTGYVENCQTCPRDCKVCPKGVVQPLTPMKLVNTASTTTRVFNLILAFYYLAFN